MLKRFPHIITYMTAGTPSVIDPETGLPTGGTLGEAVTAPCRAEPNVRHNYIIREDDGQRIEFGWLIHLDKSSARIPFGQDVDVAREGDTVASGTVHRSHKNQLHNQIWI